MTATKKSATGRAVRYGRSANPDVVNMLGTASRPRLVQQSRRAYAVSQNEHPAVRTLIYFADAVCVRLKAMQYYGSPV